jgi:hypothetical protein
VRISGKQLELPEFMWNPFSIDNNVQRETESKFKIEIKSINQ